MEEASGHLSDEDARLYFLADIYNFLEYFLYNKNFAKNKNNEKFLKIKEERVKKIMCDKMCSICIDNLRVNQKIKILSCNHIFHKNCLFKWCKKKFNCPECRHSII